MISKTEVQCANCNNKFLKLTSEIKREPGERNFCCRECYFESKKRKNETCTYCKKSYISKVKKNYKTNFCCKECQLNETKKRNDFTGNKIGRCKVIGIDEENTSKSKYWLLKCACKEVFSVRYADVKRGNIFECPNCVFRRSQYYIGGKKFGRLSVQDKWEWRISPTNGKRFRYWYCICECGNEVWINSGSIIRGHTLSCGCYIQKNSSRYVNETLYPLRHGKSGKLRDETYVRWTTLISKCYNPKYASYHNFGAEGYTVCEEWRNNYQKFYDWAHSQGFHPGLGVEIKEGKKVFSEENCYLCSVVEHANKMRSKTNLKKFGIDYEGKIHTLKEWSKILNIGYKTFYSRWQKCKDIKKCIEGEWKDGSGCHFKREDIKDEDIKKLYEDGMTIVEIEDHLNTKSVFYRLKKMGIKMRPRKYRSSVDNENVIKESLNKGESLEEIMKKCSYSSITNLKRKIKDIKNKSNVMESPI